jgi:methionyl-tRNA formyltransferase
MDKKITVSLLANTGIGNAVFRALVNNSAVIVDSIVTRKFEENYPLYDIPELYYEAEQKGVKCFFDIDVNTDYFNYIKNRKVDVILVATFNQIIKNNLLSLPNIKIFNFHPSLLPKYRGPSPIIWTLLNGEKKTGITIHVLSEKIDAGDIVLQKEVEIEIEETLGSLSHKLAIAAEPLTEMLIDGILNNKLEPKNQNPTESSYFKRPSSQRFFYHNDPLNIVETRLRAFHPFPGSVYVDEDDNKFIVLDYWFEIESGIVNNEVLILKKEGKEIFMKINTYSE